MQLIYFFFGQAFGFNFKTNKAELFVIILKTLIHYLLAPISNYFVWPENINVNLRLSEKKYYCPQDTFLFTEKIKQIVLSFGAVRDEFVNNQKSKAQ